MDFVDLMQVVIESHKALPCKSENCYICIDIGNENFKKVNHVELRHTEDGSEAILVFSHDD